MPILGIQKGAVVSAVGTNGLLADGEMKPRRIAPNAGAENGEVSIAINAAFAGTSGLKTITSSPGSKPSICPCCENRDWFGK